MEYLPLAECKHRWLYRIKARNFSLGIFNIERFEFIGIRTKWERRYLDSENHWDCVEFATTRPVEALEEIPEHLILDLSLGIVDHLTGRNVDFDKPITDGGRGWYFIDTGESNKNINPVSIPNDALFKYLEDVEKTYK